MNKQMIKLFCDRKPQTKNGIWQLGNLKILSEHLHNLSFLEFYPINSLNIMPQKGQTYFTKLAEFAVGFLKRVYAITMLGASNKRILMIFRKNDFRASITFL